MRPFLRVTLWAVLSALGLSVGADPGIQRIASSERPNVVLIVVDTLRADRLSGMGYRRNTSPNIDTILNEGVTFTQTRTVEPLTNPAMCSILTSQMPHNHGATRNGLRLRSGLDSLPRTLSAAGYETSAFVGNWTLRDKISGLAEHFDNYGEIFNKKRWFGLFARESTAEDLVESSIEWIDQHRRQTPEQPFFTWVHFVEPHAPYLKHKQHLAQLGLEGRNNLSPSDRYDTEIAYTDAAIGDFLRRLNAISPPSDTLVVFVSDHGESLGEHQYWGHGRNLFEEGLRVPMAIRWPGHLEARKIDTLSTNLDLAPTLLGLLHIAPPPSFEGFDWTPVLRGAIPSPENRRTWHQAHKGAVVGNATSRLARRSGLISLAMVQGTRKEIFRLTKNRQTVYDLANDPREQTALTPAEAGKDAPIFTWMRTVFEGLSAEDLEPVQPLDEESVSALKSLGYVD